MTTVGIDLGTCNSVVAVYRRGRVETLPIEGSNLVPSCVAAKPGGTLLVGAHAKTRSLIDPEQSILAVKRHMGDREHQIHLGGQTYTPADISSLILKKLADGAADRLKEPVRDVVISVPAYFTNNQKEDTRLAGEKAGLKVLALVPEPTAAAIAYGVNQGRDQTILVYDLGGGTFDISILQIRGNQFEVKAIGGSHSLGGEDFDRCLIDLLITRLRNLNRLPSTLDEAAILPLYVKLKETAEAAKKELSQADAVELMVPDMGTGELFALKVTRDEYEAVIGELVESTITITLETLKRAGMRPDDVDRVVLVGGSTRIPLIHRTLAARIVEPYISDNVDEVVAHGAAIMAANLSACSEGFAPIEVTNITAHSLGIRVDQDKFAILIPRGTHLPATFNKTFTTARANADRTDVVIFQGEDSLCSNNLQIGGFGLTGISRAAAGVPKIDVTFTVDGDDILKVGAVDRSTARSGEVIIERFNPKPYMPTPEKKGRELSALRFGVSQVGCDDAGSVLKQMNLNCTKLSYKEFRDAGVLRKYDVVFINCMADITQLFGNGLFLNPKKNASALREFVSMGGVLYVSDYAMGNISVPFPDKMRFGGRFSGKKGQTEATVQDPELKQLIGPTCPITFNLDYQTVEWADSGCRVYLTRGKVPILVSFAHGDGHVVYTSFHHGKQLSDRASTLLSSIMLQTISLATDTPLVELAEANNIRAVEQKTRR